MNSDDKDLPVGGSEALAYLKVATEAAEKGQWLAAQLNANEAAKYAGIAERVGSVPKKEA